MIKFFEEYHRNTLKREENYQRFYSFLMALIFATNFGLQAESVKRMFDLIPNSDQKKIAEKYERLFKSLDNNLNLDYFSSEEIMLIALNLTTNNYDPIGHEISMAGGAPVMFENGGVCRHKAKMMELLLNEIGNLDDTIQDSSAYSVSGAYKEKNETDGKEGFPRYSNHLITAWEYTSEGITYQIFIDATSGALGYYDLEKNLVIFGDQEFKLYGNSTIVNFNSDNKIISIEDDHIKFLERLKDTSNAQREKNIKKCKSLNEKRKYVSQKYKKWYSKLIADDQNLEYKINLTTLEFYLSTLNNYDCIYFKDTTKLKELYKQYVSLNHDLSSNGNLYFVRDMNDNNNFIVSNFFRFLENNYVIKNPDGTVKWNDEKLKNGLYAQLIDNKFEAADPDKVDIYTYITSIDSNDYIYIEDVRKVAKVCDQFFSSNIETDYMQNNDKYYQIPAFFEFFRDNYAEKELDGTIKYKENGKIAWDEKKLNNNLGFYAQIHNSYYVMERRNELSYSLLSYDEIFNYEYYKIYNKFYDGLYNFLPDYDLEDDEYDELFETKISYYHFILRKLNKKDYSIETLNDFVNNFIKNEFKEIGYTPKSYFDEIDPNTDTGYIFNEEKFENTVRKLLEQRFLTKQQNNNSDYKSKSQVKPSIDDFER